MKPDFRYTIFLIFILLTASFYGCSQDTTKVSVQRYEFSLGAAIIPVYEIKHSTNLPFQLVHLHHNETTADSIARKFSNDEGINFLQILNAGKRLIDFETVGYHFRFDPNRMFSREGIIASLQLHSRHDDAAYDAIHAFQQQFLQLLDSSRTVVAMHNNTDGRFTPDDYINNKTGLVHRNPSHDEDDFFITTDSTIFRKLKEKNFNVVWEWSDKLKDDGSLSIYCSRKNIPYVNIEAEHGHYTEQAAMLQALIEILK